MEHTVQREAGCSCRIGALDNPVLGGYVGCPIHDPNKRIFNDLSIFRDVHPLKDEITQAVIDDLKARSDKGVKKYNTTLHDNNKDDFMNHLYEELLDAAQYCKKELSFTKEIQKIIKETPDDSVLGEKIRKIYGK